MGRTKAIANRPKPRTSDIHVGLNDEIPTDFVDRLLAISSTDESEPDSERPVKRLKQSLESLSSVSIAREELLLLRRCPSISQLDGTITRKDVGSSLALWLGASVDRPIMAGRRWHGDHLKIASRSKSSYFQASVALQPASISERLAIILEVARRPAPKVGTEGTIWASIDLSVERCADSLIIKFIFELRWNETKLYANLRPTQDRALSQKVLDEFLPSGDLVAQESLGRQDWSPLDFYEAAFVPSKDDVEPLSIDIPELTATLYPYQKRSLQWLLNREGARWSNPTDGSPRGIEQIRQVESPRLPHSFRQMEDVNGKTFYLSHLYHVVTTDLLPFKQADDAVRGGILAEEMGLGKTLEVIALILLHRRPAAQMESSIGYNGEKLRPTSATLIVTPESLRQQWLTEFERHAPQLRVKSYPGRKHLSEESEESLLNDLASQDVVVTTYGILASELHYATKPPDRSRRQERKYHRPSSPLVQLSWWRVCLDEAQMIESGVSGAAMVARVIPRVNAWGITGTPVKSDVKDLFGLLLFLRYEPYCSSPPIWKALTNHHKDLFRSLFHRISLRHTKRLVRDEIDLPPQSRFVITMPFTAVEEQHYQSLFQEMTEACALDAYGTPLVNDWNPEDCEDLMRTWLNRLRQTALHPEVGIQNRRALGHRAGPLRTVDEVLNAMIEQSVNAIRSDQRAYFTARLTRGQLHENGPLVKEAQAIWESVKKDITDVVTECREELKAATQEAKQSGEAKAREAAGINGSGENLSSQSISGDSDSEDDLDDLGISGRVREARSRLRLALEIQHRAVFFCANAYFQIKENKDMTAPDSEEFNRLKQLEEEGYEFAKKIRKEILSDANGKATKLMERLAQLAGGQSFAVIPELQPNDIKGLESAPIVEKLEALYGILNMQANQIDEWREHVIGLLLQPLIDEEESTEITGEEFGESTKIQEELMAYVQALRSAIADRQDAISGQENQLVKHETKTSKALAKEGDGPAPEKVLELLSIRDKLKPPQEQGSMRGVISELRAISSKFQDKAGGSSRATMEHEVVTRQIKDTQAQVLAQNKAALALEQEIDRFTTIMNTRLEYYRQLQAVSDSVSPYEGVNDDNARASLLIQENVIHRRVDTAEAKLRYLTNLRESGAKSGEPRMCIICQSPFTTGVLTVCGHQFCKDCMAQWFRAHHNCPVCKRQLRASELHDITIKPRELRIHADGAAAVAQDQQRSPKSKKTGIYSEFGAEKLAQINHIKLNGPSFTTKVDSIVRHLLWLRESDPGAKSIIFSQYRDFLSVLGLAFSRHRIGYSSIDKHNGITRFKEDPSVECFLLHGRAQSSGLNLVNASHVFLCEPLLNTAIELQAIARVDRIGQQHETTVWLYLIDGTVEESIYNLSVQRRLEHMSKHTKGKSKESTPELLEPNLEAANTLELEQAALSKLMSKDKTAGEAVDTSDLWECLFGHLARSHAMATPTDDRLQDSSVMRFLAAEAADERRRDEASSDA